MKQEKIAPVEETRFKISSNQMSTFKSNSY